MISRVIVCHLGAQTVKARTKRVYHSHNLYSDVWCYWEGHNFCTNIFSFYTGTLVLEQ